MDHRADNLVVISRGSVENYFYIFGGKDERSQDLIQGITLAGVFFDEVELMPESFVNQATGRCSVDGSKYWFNCNPDGPYHWFKQNWIDKRKEKHLLYLHFTMDDNLSLSEKVKARYRSMYTGVFYRRYILGLWAMAEGIIYDMFSEERHVADPKTFSDSLLDGNRYVSCDYGTQNATVFLLWNQGTDGIWYCTREYYYSGREKGQQKTDAEYADDLESWLSGTDINAVIVDPAAASFIAELKKHGYRVIKAKYWNDGTNRWTCLRLSNDIVLLFVKATVTTKVDITSAAAKGYASREYTCSFPSEIKTILYANSYVENNYTWENVELKIHSISSTAIKSHFWCQNSYKGLPLWWYYMIVAQM